MRAYEKMTIILFPFHLHHLFEGGYGGAPSSINKISVNIPTTTSRFPSPPMGGMRLYAHTKGTMASHQGLPNRINVHQEGTARSRGAC